jgi:cytochrome c1
MAIARYLQMLEKPNKQADPRIGFQIGFFLDMFVIIAYNMFVILDMEFLCSP